MSVWVSFVLFINRLRSEGNFGPLVNRSAAKCHDLGTPNTSQKKIAVGFKNKRLRGENVHSWFWLQEH